MQSPYCVINVVAVAVANQKRVFFPYNSCFVDCSPITGYIYDPFSNTKKITIRLNKNQAFRKCDIYLQIQNIKNVYKGSLLLPLVNKMPTARFQNNYEILLDLGARKKLG